MFVCILKDEIGTVDYYCATRGNRSQQGETSLLAWQIKFN